MSNVIAMVTLVPLGFMIAMLYDLKANRWEWTNKQRYCFVVGCVLVTLWLIRKTTAIWLHIVVCALALGFLLQTLRSWYRHKQIGGTFTLRQLVTKVVISLVSIYTIYLTITRIIQIKFF